MSERDHLSDETLNEYLDDALSAQAAARTDEHLRICDSCAHRLSLKAKLFSALDNLPEVPLEADLKPRIVERLRSRVSADRLRTRRPSWRLRLALVGEAAGALLLLGLAAPEAVSQLGAAVIPGMANSFLSAMEEAGVYLSAWIATPDPLGLQALASGLSAPSIPWASVSSLITLLAAATVVWLLGNGILLRRGPLSEQRRKP
jgi:anti-sigma factor RsiW